MYLRNKGTWLVPKPNDLLSQHGDNRLTVRQNKSGVMYQRNPTQGQRSLLEVQSGKISLNFVISAIH